MDDYKQIILSAESELDLVGAKNRLNPRLPLDVRFKLNEILIFYWDTYTLRGAFERMNKRTVQAIIDAYDATKRPAPIASGEIDGVRYALYETPDATKGCDVRPGEEGTDHVGQSNAEGRIAEDYESIVLSGDTESELSQAMNALQHTVPPDVMRKLRRAFMSYVYKYGRSGPLLYLNKLTVRDIITGPETGTDRKQGRS